MKFYKYHGLGNDYIVIDPVDGIARLTKTEICRICHRNYGIGSDGILLGPFKNDDGKMSVRIYNPDGSEAEKSGNGLRIFSRYLWDKGLVSDQPFTVSTIGGLVKSQILENGKMIKIEMGAVSFESSKIPVTGPSREVINEKIIIGENEFIMCAASIGNPHCVIIKNEISPEMARRFGPKIENHDLFPNRINVQFVKVIDRANIQIEIWERGAGYTLASGSSSCAAAAVSYKLGLSGKDITVHMPGGKLKIGLNTDFSATLAGPVTRVAEGVLDAEMFN